MLLRIAIRNLKQKTYTPVMYFFSVDFSYTIDPFV